MKLKKKNDKQKKNKKNIEISTVNASMREELNIEVRPKSH